MKCAGMTRNWTRTRRTALSARPREARVDVCVSSSGFSRLFLEPVWGSRLGVPGLLGGIGRRKGLKIPRAYRPSRFESGSRHILWPAKTQRFTRTGLLWHTKTESSPECSRNVSGCFRMFPPDPYGVNIQHISGATGSMFMSVFNLCLARSMLFMHRAVHAACLPRREGLLVSWSPGLLVSWSPGLLVFGRTVAELA